MTKILIVEDNLDYAEDMAEFLVELEHEVHITSSAGDMWAALSHGNVDVVVLDLGLPDEDGFNVIPRMRQLYPQIGLLVLTGRVLSVSKCRKLHSFSVKSITAPINSSWRALTFKVHLLGCGAGSGGRTRRSSASMCAASSGNLIGLVR